MRTESYAFLQSSELEVSTSTAITVALNASALIAVTGKWEELSRFAKDQNPFYEPPAFLPAYRNLAEKEVQVVLIWREQRLIGFFPVLKKTLCSKFVFTYLQMWRHLYCYLSTPLIHQDFAEEAILAFQGWVQKNSTFPHIVKWDMLGGEAITQHLVSREARKCKGFFYVEGSYKRSTFDASQFENYDEYLKKRSSRRRKSLRHKERQLQKEKGVKFECFTPTEPSKYSRRELESWTEEFLTLENKGWKGNIRTSLASYSRDAEFFRELVREFFNLKQLHFLRLRIGEKTIASKCSFFSEGKGYALRIAYDEDFSHLSPGLLLELHNIRAMLNGAAPFRTMDSCAAPEHPLFQGIWDCTRPIVCARLFHSKLAGQIWQFAIAAKRFLKSGNS